jgi:pSer/pThr/pTyr-binding forkhead associated (FHA) protein
MPLTLILRSASLPAGTPFPELTFDGPRVVVGRGAGCDMRLPDPSVSHRHVTFRAAGSDWTLVDEGSTNGTFVGEERVQAQAPRPIAGGEMVRVGRVWLEVRIDQTPPTRDLKFATRDLALALVSQAMRALGANADTCVHVSEGPDAGQVLALVDEGRVYTIGRDGSCDLPLRDEDTSRVHARLARRGATVLVRDAGSKNGTRLGETRVTPDRDVPWKPGVPLILGATTLALEEPAAMALAELEAAQDEPMAPGDVTEAPAPSIASGPPTGTPEAVRTGSSVAPVPPRAAPPVKRSRWTPTDIAVIVAALAVIGLSFAGLWWLLQN